MVTTHPPAAVGPATGAAQPALGRPLVLILGAAAVVVAAAGIRAGAEIIAPTMLGLVLTIAVLPLVHWARGHGWPSWAATLLSLVAACAMLLVFVFGLSLAAVKLIEQLPQYADNAAELRS